MAVRGDERWEGLHSTVIVRRPAARVLVLIIEGSDGGELGDRLFRAIDADVAASDRIELFIDARDTRGTSVDVSSRWAAWLVRHKSRLRTVSLLARSRYVQLTGDVLRRFAAFGDRMRIYTDAREFDAAVLDAVRRATGDTPPRRRPSLELVRPARGALPLASRDACAVGSPRSTRSSS